MVSNVPHTTLPALFDRSATRYPDNEAIDGTTYSQLQAWIHQYAAGLKAEGISRGDAVCLLFGSKSMHAAALAMAIMRVGAIYVPLSPSFPKERLRGQCQTVAGNSTLALLIYGVEENDRLKAQSASDEMNIRIRPQQALVSGSTDKEDMSSVNGQGMLLFTSGSSGPPKAIVYRHRQLAIALQAPAKAFDFDHKTRVCNVVPYVWDGGNFDLFGPLITGSCVRFCHEITPDGVAKTILEDNCSWALLPPSVIATMSFEALSRLSMLVSGGESASVAQFRAWSSQLAQISNTRLVNAYGLTESGIINSVWECPSQMSDSMTTVPIGRPFANSHMDIVPDTNELVVVGPQVADGYLGTASGSATFIQPPSTFSKDHMAVRTGDEAREDEDNQVHIVGRLDDQICISAVRIEPAESEAAACSLPEIDFAHVFTLKLSDNDLPALVLAYHVRDAVSSHQNGPLTKDEYEQYRGSHEGQIRQRMAEAVPGYQYPSAYFPLKSIPRTISSKKDAKQIARWAEEALAQGLMTFEPFSLDV